MLRESETSLAADRQRPMTRGAVRIALVAATLAVVATYGPHLTHTTDDGFITYRYARNLAEGHGLVFNDAERHLGTTAPGWAVVLAVTALVPGSDAIPGLSGLLSLVALVAALGMLSRRLQPASWPLTFAVALGLACNRWLVEVLGHEGFAVTLLALIALELSDLGRDRGSGILWGIAFFVRPDSAVMGAVSGLRQWRRRRSIPLWLLVSFLATAGVVAMILLWVAGAVIPFGFHVKRAEAGVPSLAVGAPYWTALVAWGVRTWGWGGPPLLVLAAWGWWRSLRDESVRAVSFLAPALAMLVLYPLVGVPFAPWYLIVPIIGVIAGAAAAVSGALTRGRLPLKLAALSLAAVSVAGTVVWSARIGSRPPDPRAEPMRAAAAWVERHSEPTDGVAAVEVGFFGFACRRPVLDLMGLGSPGALEALTTSGLAEFFLDSKVAFLVDNPRFHYILNSLLTDPRFRSGYEKVHTVAPTDRYPVAITIWKRVSVSSAVTPRQADAAAAPAVEPDSCPGR